MKYFQFAFSILLLVLLSACANPEIEKEIKLPEIPTHFSSILLDDSITFSYPKELLPVENLKLHGDFQFADLINVQYTVLQFDDTEKSLKAFANEKIIALQNRMVEPSSNELVAFQLKKINGYESQFDADLYGWPSRLHFWISIVELNSKYVTTIAWTTKDRIKEFEEAAEMIVKSFR